MKLYEFQAKELFAQGGIPIPRGTMVTDPEAAAAAAAEIGRSVVKAQAHAGGRGKAGFIKVADAPAQAQTLAAAMLGETFKGFVISRLLIEEAVDIDQEYYLAITVDRESKSPIMICSAKGGIDIEDVAETDPDAIVSLVIDVAYGPWDFQLRDLAERAKLDPKSYRQFVDIAKKLYDVFIRNDAALAEINPLMVLKDGRMIAADAKFDIDDNALFRHEALLGLKEEAEEDPIEAEAHRQGVTYVKLPGDIGIMGNGAGIVMGTLDMVTREGGAPANFCDIGGGASEEVVRRCLSVVLMNPNVKGVLINVFGGITRGDAVAGGVLAAVSSLNVKVPIVVRMAGTRAEEGLKLLEGSALVPEGNPVEAARKIIALVKGA